MLPAQRTSNNIKKMTFCKENENIPGKEVIRT